MSKKVVIIGGVAGGASTAARLRRMDEHSQIIMLERGPYISFANCGLPYHIGKTIVDRDELLLQTPESFNARFNVDVRVENEVLSIERAQKTVEIKELKSGRIYKETYDVLVLSPGSSPIRPKITGIDLPSVFSLWNMKDMDDVIAFIDAKNPRHATVVGGGFIGIEMAENLVELGMEVSLVEMADQVMAPVDFDMAQLVHEHLGH
ncbi:MAG: FAD-dependent oxidoreductase, partial [Vallitaleaceae bacterium]|nr:FAD-dependent oxidoreductase [Vallitaleaceae bacterium]